MAEKSRMSIEESIARIEKIVEQLSDSSVTLDKSLKLYTEGIKLSEQCLEEIENVEQIIEKHTLKEVR